MLASRLLPGSPPTHRPVRPSVLLDGEPGLLHVPVRSPVIDPGRTASTSRRQRRTAPTSCRRFFTRRPGCALRQSDSTASRFPRVPLRGQRHRRRRRDRSTRWLGDPSQFCVVDPPAPPTSPSAACLPSPAAWWSPQSDHTALYDRQRRAKQQARSSARRSRRRGTGHHHHRWLSGVCSRSPPFRFASDVSRVHASSAGSTRPVHRLLLGHPRLQGLRPLARHAHLRGPCDRPRRPGRSVTGPAARSPSAPRRPTAVAVSRFAFR